MLRWVLITVLALAAIAVGTFYWLTAPRPISAADLPSSEGDPERGQLAFWAAGCAGCHAAPEAKSDDDKLRLGGGLALPSPFGTFYAPNISPHPKDGIGGWSMADFVNAMVRGLAPDSSHYYPAFPYTSYQRMTMTDLADLRAFLGTLPAVENVAPDHDLPFPFNVRRGLGIWKQLYLDGRPFEPDSEADDLFNRGKYLSEGPGHCGECHTPRSVIGGLDPSRWLAGAPNPEGEGYVPNITPHGDGLGDWSEAEIAFALETGLTPSYDALGSSMANVVSHLSKLPASDREAIARYLKSIPPLPGTRPARP